MPSSPIGWDSGGMCRELSRYWVHTASPNTKLSRSQGSCTVISAALRDRFRPLPPLSSESMRKQVQAVRRRTSASMNSSRVGRRLPFALGSWHRSITSTSRIAIPRYIHALRPLPAPQSCPVNIRRACTRLMLGVSRSDWRIWRAWAAKALLASICDLNGAGGSLTNLSMCEQAREHVN